MNTGIKSQLGGASKKAPIRNPLEEVLEVVKSAGEQAGVKPVIPEQSQTAPQSEALLPQPSLLEKKKPSQLLAMENELKEIRMQREQKEEQVEMVEKQEEKQEEQLEVKKKQSFFEKGLALVRKRGPGIETRKPKAA